MGEKLKNQLTIRTVINLSKHKFSKATYELLNNNLNFVPFQKMFNEINLIKILQIFTEKLNSQYTLEQSTAL